MIGAIIGDLAASSWENDRKGFYRNLVTDRSQLSECGLCMLAAFATGMDRYDFQVFQKEFSDFFLAHSRGLSCSQEWEDFFSSGCRPFNKKVSVRIYAACLVLAGWQKYPEEMAMGLSNSLKLDKEGFYASSFSSVIWNLRQGRSKNDIVYHLAQSDHRVDTILRWHESHHYPSEGHEEDLEYYLNYAWRCFRYSWDFTSAIHEAMRCCPDSFDRHLLGMLTGAIAEAMYGSSHCLLKEKYAVNGAVSIKINIPRSLLDDFQSEFMRLREYESKERVFFPKNASRTNVERQTWIPWHAERLPADLHSEYHRRLLKSYEPGWDYRYSVYLDDGWFYLCRSFFLIARFRMVETTDGRWKITDTQRCRSESDAQIAMDEVLYVIVHRWNLVSEEEEPGRIDFCRYYRWQPECPFPADSPRGRFWHGEMMFVTEGLDMEEWKRKAKVSVRGMDERMKEKFLSYSEEERALLFYISNLYAKWRPYDNQDWIFEY